MYPNPGALDEQVVAALLGCEPERLAEIRSALGSVLNLACDELFANEGFEQSVRSLPFAPGDVVVAVGDSITADALSWAELLVASLRRVGPVEWTLINAAVSSTTSSDLIANFESIASKNPSHVIAMIGTNDARRHGRGAKARMTSPTETARNLRLYGEMVRRLSRARLILLTPPPIHEERALRHSAFAEGNVSWRFSEVVQVAEIVRRQRGSVVDIHRAFLAKLKHLSDCGRYSPECRWAKTHRHRFGQRPHARCPRSLAANKCITRTILGMPGLSRGSPAGPAATYGQRPGPPGSRPGPAPNNENRPSLSCCRP